MTGVEGVEKDSNHAHYTDTARYSNLGAVRSAADLALQPCVGLLPEWRVGIGGAGAADSVPDGPRLIIMDA